MADKTITIKEPSETTIGITIMIERRDAGAFAVNVQCAGVQSVRIASGDLTVKQRSDIDAICKVLLDLSKPTMGF